MAATATLQADEKLALDLMAAIRMAAEELCAPSHVDLVSVTVDVSARIEDASKASFDSRIDRRTRTILFAGGSATVDGTIVMTATAVYSIRPA
jgi:phosphoenolpyruvate synthase/pyruvate phosphate dikinase